MAAGVEFSIRGYVANMRAADGVEARRPFGIADLPPMQAPSYRWWADDLASAVAAAASSPSPSPRRSMGKSRTPKKRSISDIFAAAPPLAVAPSGSSGGGEIPDVDDDEALCAIVLRAKEEKRRKKKLLEEAASAAAAEGSGRREPEGNFSARKEALEKQNMPDELDTRAPNKPEGVQLLGKEKENITYVKRMKQGKNNNTQYKGDSPKCTESKKVSEVVKPQDLGKMRPLQSILKYTKRTFKMVKEKPGSSKGTEVIEFRNKSVKRVKFSEVNDVLGSKTQSCKLPKQKSPDNLLDAMASSSSSMSSSSSSMGMSGEGSKCITTESISYHRPEEALTQNKEAKQNTEHEDSPELPLIDLNKALPESADLDFTYDSNSEVPNVGHTHEVTFSGVQVLDGTENQRDLSSDSYGMGCQQPATELESIKNSRPADTLLHSEAMEVDTELSLRELDGTHRDCNTSLVTDDRSTWMSPCSLPDSTVQDQFQHYQNGFSTNLNHDGSQLSTGGDASSCRPRECNMSGSEKPHFQSGLNVRNECRPATEQTVRLMGKDLTVSTSRGECSGEMAGKHVGNTSSDDCLKRDIPLELPHGQSFLSLHGEGFPSMSASPTSTSHVSSYSAGTTSQTHFGYRTPHDLRHPFPAASAFSGDWSPHEHRFVDFSNPQPNQRLQVGYPPLPNHGSAAFHQSSLPPWRYYSDPFNRTEPSTAPVLLGSRHGTSSSVPHGNSPQPYSVHPASSSVRPHNSASFMFSHPSRIDQEASGVIRDPAVPSRNLDNRSGGAIPDNVRRDAALPSRNPEIGTVRAAPDNSNASSSGQHAQKRPGLVKLTPGAKHLLVPNGAAGDNSVPVYSYFSFGGKRANASSSQNKGA